MRDCVVEVIAALGNGKLRGGSGYLIGDGLVLTARHVLGGDNARGECQVRPYRSSVWASADVVWAGSGVDDGVLLAIRDGNDPHVSRTEFGRLAGAERVACEAIGFPWAQHRESEGQTLRRTERLVGEIDVVSGWSAHAAGLLTVHLKGSPPVREGPESPWAGISGAALLCGPLLVGIVVADPARFGSDRLVAVPITRLVRARGFADAVRTARSEPLTLQTVESVGVLERPYEPAPPMRARESSSYLLSARYGVVPFLPREELAHLRRWSATTRDVDLALLTGFGGSGKTRLARELCALLARESEWVAGPLKQQHVESRLSLLLGIDAPLLVAIDYAEGRLTQVARMIGDLLEASSPGQPRRLLLIARQIGDWWTELRKATEGDTGKRLLDGATIVDLGSARASGRAKSYRTARLAFGKHIRTTAVPAEARALTDPVFDTLLFVHMAALSDASGETDVPIVEPSSIRTDLLGRALEREARYWSDTAQAALLPADVDSHLQLRAVAIATLASPTAASTPSSEDETAELLKAISDLRDDALIRRRVARWLHDLYTPSAGWVGPLEPDLLGEALVARAVSQLPTLARELLKRAEPATAARALTVLARGARHHDACRIAIKDVLDHELETIADIAVDVAQQLGEPLGSLLADALRRHGDSGIAASVLGGVPIETISLREVAAVAAGNALREYVDHDEPVSPWHTQGTLRGSVAALCRDRALVRQARNSTRYWETDRIDDEAILEQLGDVIVQRVDESARKREPSLLMRDADFVADILADEARRMLRHQLVMTLITRYRLFNLVAESCRQADMEGWEPQLTYCLVVLCQRPTPRRGAERVGTRAGLVVGEPAFPDELARWARIVIANLRGWADRYTWIQDEAEYYAIDTLRELIGRRYDDDAADLLADRLSVVIASSERIENMSLDLARAVTSSPGDYVFQEPLSRWVAARSMRAMPPATVELGELEREGVAAPAEPDKDELNWAIGDDLVARVRGLSESHGHLPDLIRIAEQLERQAGGLRLTKRADSMFVQRFRAELAYVTDEMRAEERSVSQLLAYLVIALRRAVRRQAVAVLSLRVEAVDSRVRASMAKEVQNLLERREPPVPSLIAKVARAPKNKVPRNRLASLVLLTETHEARDRAFDEIVLRFDAMPETVNDVRSIAAAVPGGMSVRQMLVVRNQVFDELAAVDPVIGRLYRRYAMTGHRGGQSEDA